MSPRYQLTTPQEIAKFWEGVSVGEPDSCWEWNKCRSNGYGFFNNAQRKLRAHRVAYILTHGPIDDGLLVCHKCDNRPCCNPSHLMLGSAKINMQHKFERNRAWSGSRMGRSLLTKEQVISIRREYLLGKSIAELAVEFNLTRQTATRFITGKTWKDATPAPLVNIADATSNLLRADLVRANEQIEAIRLDKLRLDWFEAHKSNVVALSKLIAEKGSIRAGIDAAMQLGVSKLYQTP